MGSFTTTTTSAHLWSESPALPAWSGSPKSRTRHRQDAFGKNEGPKEIAKHTRLIAEAYARLAEIEENLEIGDAEPVPGGTDAEWAEEDERIASLGVVDEVSQWPE